MSSCWLWLPCKIVPLWLKIVPEANSTTSSPSFRILKNDVAAMSLITPNPNLAFVESLKMILFKCSVILILYFIPWPSGSSSTLCKGSRWLIFALIVKLQR